MMSKIKKSNLPTNNQKKRKNRAERKDNIRLTLLALPTIILLLIFSYWPMYGAILAFKDFKVPLGIWGSPWVEEPLKNFNFFLQSQDAWRITRNTIGLNTLFIFVSTACAIVFALLLFEVKKRWHTKIYQTVAIMPSFLSWVIVSYIVYIFLDPSKGIVNNLLNTWGMESIPWYTEAKYWPVILLIVKIWQGVGLSSVIYYASLMGIDTELFEAAEMDGASKLQRVRYISLPFLVPIVTIMTIMAFGGIFRGDFGLFYNVTRNVGALYPTTDVIDTYVFRALMKQGNIGMSSAAGLLQSVVCTITLLVVNGIAKKINPENSLF